MHRFTSSNGFFLNWSTERQLPKKSLNLEKKQILERLEGVGFLQQFEFAAVAEEKSAANSIIIVKNVHLQVLLI